MSWILLCFISCAALVLFFKLEQFTSMNIPQVIIFNYLFAALPFFFLPKPDNIHILFSGSHIFYLLTIGFLFIGIFLFIGLGVRKIGASKVVLAQKLSFLIPSTFAIYVYHDMVTIVKIVGFLTAVLAIFLITLKGKNSNQKKPFELLFILVIWLGSGIIDTLIKIETHNAGELSYFISDLIYVSTALFSIVYLIYLLLFKHEIITFKSIVLGLCLGMLNYIALFAFVQCLNLKDLNSSTFFPINNMGIIITTTLTSILLFKEHLSKTAYWGILLGLTSIYFILY